MNQFVNQLMFGSPLYSSSGAPDYNPLWTTTASYIFAAQYFMEIYSNSTAKAAAGPSFNASAGDVLWTNYSLDVSWHWTLAMGVVGDASRTSSFVSTMPYMGLLANETTSWSDPEFRIAHFNSCWEMYGADSRQNYPSSSSVFNMRTTRPSADFAWETSWSNGEMPTCPGHPNAVFSEMHNDTQQNVQWSVFLPPA